MEQIAGWKSFGGEVRRYRHRSDTLDCDMVFGVFLPPQAARGPVPALWWLSGLTCTDENFMQKAGAQRRAA
ncbi:MAG: alpha/beta hydrolase-fold protein, partial [Gammaproteobacteria bacterium]